MAKLFNNVGVFTTTNAGTGNPTLGAVIDDSYLTPAEAGVVNGDVCTYKLSQGLDFEIGRGSYSSAGPSWSRATVLVSKIGGVVGTTKINSVIGDEFRIVAADIDYISPDLVADGILARTAEDAYTSRTITGTANEIEVTQGDGVAGNPTIGLPATIAVTAIELGATDTTLARINPGVVTIEGVTVATSSNTLTLTNKTFDANGTGNSITNIETPDIAAATLVTAADTIVANDNDTSWPTTAAVIDYVTATAGGIANVVEDLTPQLGGNLDANTFNVLFDDATGILDAASNEQLIFQQTTTAVNFWQMTNSAANGVQRLEAAGTDASIAITIASKGTDPINFEVNAAIEVTIDGTSLSPAADGGSSLGQGTTAWQNLFLNLAATINIDNGDWIATHTTGGILTVATGDDLRMTTAGTNALSVVVVGGAQTLTNKTISHGSNTITGTIAQFNTALTDGDFVTLPTGSGALPADPGADRFVFWDDSAGALTYLTAGASLTITTTTVDMSQNQRYRSITFVIDGGGAVITTGLKGFLEIPFACTIDRWTLICDLDGSLLVDIWKNTFSTTAVPTNANSITGTGEPEVVSNFAAQSAPTGWSTTTINAGDILAFAVEGTPAVVTMATLSLRVSVT